MEQLLSQVENYIHTSPWLALVAVFFGGIVTASNPCVLAMIPLMIGVVAGRDESKKGALRSLSLSLVFVVGLAVTFTVLGISAALAGSLYGEVSSAWNWVVAGVCLLMGMHLMDLVTLPIPTLGTSVAQKASGFLGALTLGLLFGFVSAPCAAPILVVLLAYLAGSGGSLLWGGALLFVYALGHSVLIVLAGSSMGAARHLIENKMANRSLSFMRRGAGLLIILVGVFFAYEGL